MNRLRKDKDILSDKQRVLWCKWNDFEVGRVINEIVSKQEGL